MSPVVIQTPTMLLYCLGFWALGFSIACTHILERRSIPIEGASKISQVHPETLILKPEALTHKPKPQNLNPKPQTLNPKP